MRITATMFSGGAAIAGGLLLASSHYFGETSGSTHDWYPALGFGAPFIGLGVLALVGERTGESWLTVWSGFFLATIGFVSVVLGPLVLAAGVLMVQGLRQHDLSQRDPSQRDLPQPRPATARPNGGFLAPWVLAAAPANVFWLLVLHKDPATWTVSDGTRSSSNIVTDTEATLSLIVVIGVVSLALKWSIAPRSRNQCPHSRS